MEGSWADQNLGGWYECVYPIFIPVHHSLIHPAPTTLQGKAKGLLHPRRYIFRFDRAQCGFEELARRSDHGRGHPQDHCGETASLLLPLDTLPLSDQRFQAFTGSDQSLIGLSLTSLLTYKLKDPIDELNG